MTIDTKLTERKLVINEAYLRRLKDNENYHRTLDMDLIDIFNGGLVQLQAPHDPRLAPLYSDVRSYICAMSIHGDYTIQPFDDYDATQIKAILGNNVIGDLQQGYKFQKKG